MKLDILSGEQEIILNEVKAGKNVIVDAVAGTGKTTMILSIATEMPDKKIVQMTYNASLKHDVRTRVKELGLTNIEIHTYHSLMKRYYISENGGYTDTEMRKIVLNDTKPIRKIPLFDMQVLDEAQDMSYLYFQFMAKFIKDMGEPIQLLIMGDYMQGLYDFKGADIRFLTLADTIWNGFTRLITQEFAKCTMKVSFRITNQICSFVNNVMLGEERMQACRDGNSVHYMRHSQFCIARMVYGEILKLFEKGITPSDIFILGGSIKGTNSKIRKLENALVERGIPCHVPMLDNEKMDERVIEGKIVFSTYHSVKGRQRKYIFVVGFDNAYMKLFIRNGDHTICPNTLYVAATRASEGLYLLENNDWDTDRPCDFLKKSHIEMKKLDYIEFRGDHQNIFKEDTYKGHFNKTTPTDLIKFIPESVIDEITPIIDRIFIKEREYNLQNVIDIPSIVKTQVGCEEVSDLNGIAIPCIYYDHLRQTYMDDDDEPNGSILFDIIENYMQSVNKNDHSYLKGIINDLPKEITTVADYLKIANVSVAVQEKLYFKLKQIDDYTWIDNKVISKCLKRLESTIGKECIDADLKVEEVIISALNEEQHYNINEFMRTHLSELPPIRFSARVDLIAESVWELKCTSRIENEHMIQVVIYAWLWSMRVDREPDKTFRIFNIKTGELMRLDATNEELNTIMIILLKAKYTEKIIKTDEEFINDCQTYLHTL